MKRLSLKSAFTAAAMLCALTLAGSPAALAQEKMDKSAKKPAAPAAGKTFVKTAGAGNLAEVQLGELAQKNSQSADVKQVGSMLVKDHGAANSKLQAVATKMGVTPFPPEPNKTQKATYAKLSKLNGADFDKTYINTLVKSSREGHRRLQKGAGHREGCRPEELRGRNAAGA